jgi:exodeoxyribonuclease VII large subunit
MRVTFSEEAEMAKSATPIGVADFLNGINATLSRHCARIVGEVTSVKDSYATAIYFTIKDTTRDALLNCVVWRTTYNQNGVTLKEGDAIVVSGTPEIYATRGTFSLKVSTIEYAGEGQLKRAYDELRAKLAIEGLLDPKLKRSLPEYPTRIGVITSRSGVVIQDFSANLGRYGFQVTLVDSRVEGKDAIHELLAALKRIAKADIEILVIMRGGGSWESLQAFNTESVVRAIANFPKPVLTGIGHDVDVTLAELVADVGASTPTAVAEKLNETWDMAASALGSSEMKIYGAFERALTRLDRGLETVGTRIPRRYEQMLNEQGVTITAASRQMHMAFTRLKERITSVSSTVVGATATMKNALRSIDTKLTELPLTLVRQMLVRVTAAQTVVVENSARILQTTRGQLRATATELSTYEKSIRVADPAHNLRLGYSLSYVNGAVVRKVSDVTPGTQITTQVADGSFTSSVKSIE